nr:hypothetical protein BDOA9_0145380 [Bradyrhizobium sp. DOA9]
MYSYHIVAELRQFRGVSIAADPRNPQAHAGGTGTDSRHSGLIRMDKICLATMISAVLLLIVAADLLVNGLGLQQDPVNLASVMPASSRLVR